MLTLSPCTASRRRGGMTLMELMVVLTVLGILVAFLLPVFASGRERGRQAVCLSNLRQLGQAMSLYEQDYGAYPPWPAVTQKLDPYVKDKHIFFCPASTEPPKIKLVTSYAFLFNGAKLRDGSPLLPRSVVTFCGDHVKQQGWDRSGPDPFGQPIRTGVYVVLRHDGASELVPAAKVTVKHKPAGSPAPGVSSAVQVLEFPGY